MNTASQPKDSVEGVGEARSLVCSCCFSPLSCYKTSLGPPPSPARLRERKAKPRLLLLVTLFCGPSLLSSPGQTLTRAPTHPSVNPFSHGGALRASSHRGGPVLVPHRIPRRRRPLQGIRCLPLHTLCLYA